MPKNRSIDIDDLKDFKRLKIILKIKYYRLKYEMYYLSRERVRAFRN